MFLIPVLVTATLLSARAEDVPDYRPFGVNAEAGTTGAGGTLSWRFSNHFGIRAGGHYLAYHDKNREIEGITYNARLRLQSEPVGLDYYPWKARSLRIGIGVLFNQNDLSGSAIGAVDVNDKTYTVTAADPLRAHIRQDRINPYLSLGGTLFYFDRAHRWGFTGELGVAYTGSPKVALSGPAFIPAGDLAAERVQLEQSAKDFRFWPILKLGVNFSF